MSGGASSRRKGARIELEAVHILQDHGLAAEKVPLSGGAGGRWTGDISVPVLGLDRRLEVKCRATGFRKAYEWLADNYGLVIRADRAEPLVCLRLRDFAELAITADRKRVGQ
jgi:Holliday junction resolvase